MTDPTPGRRTNISVDPINVDPIGNDPLDLSDAPPTQDPGPNRTALGWISTATGFFIAAVILGVIFIAVVFFLTTRAQ
jgi:hypothetical protein